MTTKKDNKSDHDTLSNTDKGQTGKKESVLADVNDDPKPNTTEKEKDVEGEGKERSAASDQESYPDQD